jgi:hypothetical protein
MLFGLVCQSVFDTDCFLAHLAKGNVGPSIDTYYQVSVHLAEGFQRRRLKCDRRRTSSDGKSSHCLWQGELKSSLCQKHFDKLASTR